MVWANVSQRKCEDILNFRFDCLPTSTKEVKTGQSVVLWP